MGEKKKYAMNMDGTQDYLQGYGNDVVVSEEQTLVWSDRLYLLIKPEDQRKLKFWPENPSRFREVLNEYSLKCNFVAEFVLKVMAESLGLEEDYFLEQMGELGTASRDLTTTRHARGLILFTDLNHIQTEGQSLLLCKTRRWKVFKCSKMANGSKSQSFPMQYLSM
ncbi:hypothetical protein Sjap_011072 [Stephania japonica]|uniref:Uncharacterized protein n=1 Tax=Stephania japonica TaxID=461633 RepID=A0AAP0P730_9MAGN